MKIQTLSALAGAATVAASASASFTVYSDYSTWAAAAATFVSPTGAVYGNDWSGVYAPSNSSGTITYGGGWQKMTAVSAGPALTLSGSNIVITQNTSAQQLVTFTFLANSWGAPYGPTGNSGLYGFGIFYTNSVGTSANVSVTLGVNTQTLAPQAGMTSGFFGVLGSTLGTDRLNTMTVLFSGNQGTTITGTAFASVPAPGAAALLGVAGLVGSRRRR